jgi:hypothetical protein
MPMTAVTKYLRDVTACFAPEHCVAGTLSHPHSLVGFSGAWDTHVRRRVGFTLSILGDSSPRPGLARCKRRARYWSISWGKLLECHKPSHSWPSNPGRARKDSPTFHHRMRAPASGPRGEKPLCLCQGRLRSDADSFAPGRGFFATISPHFPVEVLWR